MKNEQKNAVFNNLNIKQAKEKNTLDEENELWANHVNLNPDDME